VNRGDVYRLRPARDSRGREQAGERYAIVVQADEFAALSTVVVVPTSSSALAASFRPVVEVRGVRTRALVEQMRAVDTRRLGRRAGRLTPAELQDVGSALRLVLGL
jgi:mRNA interferase MazF